MNGHPPTGAYQGHRKVPQSRPHVLVVENNAALSQTLVRTLMTHLPTVKVTAVSAVEQARPILEEGNVSLLITDLHLPGIQGCSFIERLREPGVARGGHRHERHSARRGARGV
jgi:CheY-like chemotaxis protein